MHILTTLTHELLGEALDTRSTALPDLYVADTSPNRLCVLSRLRVAEAAGDLSAARVLKWELGLMDLRVPPGPESQRARGKGFEGFANFYGITNETSEYASLRANETHNPALRLHYLEFVLLTMSAKGRARIMQIRATANAYRDWVDLQTTCIESQAASKVAGTIVEIACRLCAIVTRRSVLDAAEQTEWAAWLVHVAQKLRNAEYDPADHNRPHRWPFEILANLTRFRSTAISETDRVQALALVSEAYTFFATQPLADSFTIKVAQTEHDLRSHFGERNTHQTLTRRTHDALKQKGDLFAGVGSGSVAQTMYRDARKVIAEHGQYFDREEATALAKAERDAIVNSTLQGEFTRVNAVMEIPLSSLDFTGESAEATIAGLLAEALILLPSDEDAEASATAHSEQTPFLALINTTVIDGEKVVREAVTSEEQRNIDVERWLTVHARLAGAAVVHTLLVSVEKQGLTSAHFMASLATLPVSDDTRAIIHHGMKAALARDAITALHVLCPMFEEALRCVLREKGFDTTTFRTVNRTTGTTRTDDTTLGALLSLHPGPSGSVDTVLGRDFRRSIMATMVSPSGLNLRNKVGHGKITPGDCSPEHVGIVVHAFLCLVALCASPHSNHPANNVA